MVILVPESSNVCWLQSYVYLNWVKHDENALLLRLNKIVTALMFERKLDREYISMNCKERLMRYLVKSYEKHGSVSGSFTVEKTQAELADKVGFNVRSVQRSIAALQKEGFITVKAGKITVSQEQHLKLEEFIEIEEKERSQNRNQVRKQRIHTGSYGRRI